MTAIWASFFLFCLTAVPGLLAAQLFPKENSKLHYRIIGFEFPTTGNDGCKLEIAAGNQPDATSFAKNIIVTTPGAGNKIIAEVPRFGASYTWRMVNNSGAASPLHHFSTLQTDEVDTAAMRLTIATAPEKYTDAYVFLNSNRVLYDMKGRPVWFLPHTASLRFDDKSVRDLKLTPQGTLTFVVAGRDAYEVNYDAEVLWKAPNTGEVNGDSTERYNHEFTREANGRYMVLGNQFVWSDGAPPPMNGGMPQPMPQSQNPPQPMMQGVPQPMPQPRLQSPPNGTRLLNHKILYGTIIEYDENGKVTWSWKSADHFQNSDLRNYPFRTSGPMNDVHQNSFFFDEKSQSILVSYKNLHRLLKVKYPEGTVMKTYGEIYKPGQRSVGNGMFWYQHSCRISQKGYIYLFNNNSTHSECVPEIVMLREPAPGKEDLEPVWTYEFPVLPLSSQLEGRRRGGGDETTGGNVTELPDHSMFASLCAPYADVFIISERKTVLWHAIAERWNPQENKWMPFCQYRASIIPSRSALENLIWSNRKN